MSEKNIIFETKSNRFALSLEKGFPELAFFGKKKSAKEWDKQVSRPLVGSYGTVDPEDISLLVQDEKGYFTHRLVFSSVMEADSFPQPSSPYARGARHTLVFSFKDEQETFLLEERLSVFDGSDVMASSFRLINKSAKTLKLRRIASLELAIPNDNYSLLSFHGAWGREMLPSSAPLASGSVSLSSHYGFSSHYQNPFFILEGERCSIGFNLAYSGDHKEEITSSPFGSVWVRTGLNDLLMDVIMKPSDDFITPEAYFAMEDTTEEVSQEFSSFIKKRIMRQPARRSPIVYNTWEGLATGIQEKKWKKMADLASSLGCETFVFDDGWFGKRDSDATSLGDFSLNESKLGGDFDTVNAYLKSKSLALGLWIEPEMVSPHSELASSHPEFIMAIPGVKPLQKRNQLMLNLASPAVVEYLKETLSNLFTTSKVSFVKWDFNRPMTDPYGEGIWGGEYGLRYYDGYYSLLSYLSEKFPSIYFEGCASGGGRNDLGTLSFVNDVWTSDATDPLSRLFIQEGTMAAYPLPTLANHLTYSSKEESGVYFPLQNRIDLSFFGNIGVESDITKWNEKEKREIKNAIKTHSLWQKTIHEGKLYRLTPFLSDEQKTKNTFHSPLQNAEGIIKQMRLSPSDKGWIIVSKNKKKAIVLLATMEAKEANAIPLRGLMPKKEYVVSSLSQKRTITLTGEELMKDGLTPPKPVRCYFHRPIKFGTVLYFLEAK